MSPSDKLMESHTIKRQVIEELYEEALILADEARAVFDLRERGTVDPNNISLALSVEGLKTTTRVMHLLAWLLNQRSFLDGELTQGQLSRCGQLPSDRIADPANMEKLLPETRALIRDTERLHARVARIETELAEKAEEASPVLQLQGRIAAAFRT